MPKKKSIAVVDAPKETAQPETGPEIVSQPDVVPAASAEGPPLKVDAVPMDGTEPKPNTRISITGDPDVPVEPQSKRILEYYANYIPADAEKKDPSMKRPDGVPPYANYWK